MKKGSCACGIDNEANWSCQRWVTAKAVQNWQIWIENPENEGFKILDSGNPKFSRRRPTQPSRPVGFKQETAFHIPINPIFGPASGQIYKKNAKILPFWVFTQERHTFLAFYMGWCVRCAGDCCRSLWWPEDCQDSAPRLHERSLDPTQSPRFLRFFTIFLAASAAKNCKKRAVIQSAASAASAQGGCASSRLDHGLKFYEIRGGCTSSRLINGFSDCE